MIFLRSVIDCASLNIADEVASDEDVSINSIGVVENPEELCLQLQKRLEGLTKMGGRLEKKNKGDENDTSAHSWGPQGCDAAFTEYTFETW